MTTPNWHYRELRRFADGTYKAVPWAQEAWFTAALSAEPLRHHFLHVSVKGDSLVAYTASPERGEADRQTRVKPGRYLTTFFPSLPTKEIQYWVSKFTAENSDREVLFATTPDEIESVYLNGPESCMSPSANSYESDEHPVRVYGAGDLAIAYIRNGRDGISARCVCWPEKKAYGRCYGDSVLSMKLLDLGYTYKLSAFDGARLLRIPQDDGFVCPYLDINPPRVMDGGDYLYIDSRGDFSAEYTSGMAHKAYAFTCADCEVSYGDEDDAREVDGETWCRWCADDRASRCDHCETLTTQDMSPVYTTRSYEEDWCDACVDRSDISSCDHCDILCADGFGATHADGCFYCPSCMPKEESEAEESDAGESNTAEAQVTSAVEEQRSFTFVATSGWDIPRLIEGYIPGAPWAESWHYDPNCSCTVCQTLRGAHP